MSVMQVNKTRCFMVDFWGLNMYADAFTSEMVISTEKWEWKQQGMNVSILNLRKTYLQKKKIDCVEVNSFSFLSDDPVLKSLCLHHKISFTCKNIFI